MSACRDAGTGQFAQCAYRDHDEQFVGRRAERRRSYKTLAGLKRAMGGKQLSLETLFQQRANIDGKGWTPIQYTAARGAPAHWGVADSPAGPPAVLTYADATEIATALGGHWYTQRDVRNGLLYGRIKNLSYSTRQRIVWTKRGWSYIVGQDSRAETTRIRNILKK